VELARRGSGAVMGWSDGGDRAEPGGVSFLCLSLAQEQRQLFVVLPGKWGVMRFHQACPFSAMLA